MSKTFLSIHELDITSYRETRVLQSFSKCLLRKDVPGIEHFNKLEYIRDNCNTLLVLPLAHGIISEQQWDELQLAKTMNFKIFVLSWKEHYRHSKYIKKSYYMSHRVNQYSHNDSIKHVCALYSISYSPSLFFGKIHFKR